MINCFEPLRIINRPHYNGFLFHENKGCFFTIEKKTVCCCSPFKEPELQNCLKTLSRITADLPMPLNGQLIISASTSAESKLWSMHFD